MCNQVDQEMGGIAFSLLLDRNRVSTIERVEELKQLERCWLRDARFPPPTPSST